MDSQTVDVSMLANFVGGREVPSISSRSLPILEPNTGATIGHVPMSTPEDLDEAIRGAAFAQKDWAEMPLKDRVQVLFRFKTLIEKETGTVTLGSRLSIRARTLCPMTTRAPRR